MSKIIFFCFLVICYFVTPLIFGSGAIEISESVSPEIPEERDIMKPPFQEKLPASKVARVLGAKHYSYDTESELSPVDLALGWGPMSSDHVIDNLRISQSSRFYYYRYQNPPPIPKASIITNSSNMHLIPATRDLDKRLRSIDEGDVVQISGYLADIKRDDGWRWTSSRSRSDSGKGACEIIFVTFLEKR